ncbi:MAG: hypothetical protein WAL67_07040, partial [Candidatus Cybelea sp.]
VLHVGQAPGALSNGTPTDYRSAADDVTTDPWPEATSETVAWVPPRRVGVNVSYARARADA